MEVLGMLQQVMSIAVLASITATPPAVSQGIGRSSSISGSAVIGPPATKVLVATPYPANATDSAASVAIGNALRDKLIKNLSSGDWRVITQREMNDNLQQSGYNRDALLPPLQAQALANALTARIVVTTAVNKSADGQFIISARMYGVSDDAGQVVKATQAPGQQLADFGAKAGDQVVAIFKAYTDAKACTDQEATNKQKATDAATKALKAIPNYGYAEYCLGEIEQSKDSTSAATQQHFRNAAIGDPMSLKAVNQLAVIDDRKHDTTAVINDFKQMLTIAPTNKPLAETARAKFIAYGHPEAAEELVANQIKLDPTNPDWYDLRGNTGALQASSDTVPATAKAKFACAYGAYDQEFTLDPSRADSIFFQKVIYVAGTAPDSLTWAKRFVEKFPASTTPLEVEASIYTALGQTDSAVAVANKIAAIDPTDSRPVLAVVQSLLKANQFDAALKFVPYVTKHGDEAAKNNFAGLVINAVQPLAQQTPRPDSLMVLLGQAVIDVAPTAPNYLVFGNYFMAIGLADQLTPLSTATRSAKSCDAAKAEDALLTRLEPALVVAAGSTNEGIATFAKGFQANLPPEKAYVAGVIKEQCKP
jgi:tetratricopeptide (TPR) repeat protein